MARANDPAPFWLDVRSADGRPDPGSPPALGWINPDQLFVVLPDQARPQPAVAPGAVARILRSDDPDPTGVDLFDFLSLPSSLQEMIGLQRGGLRRTIFVIANGDRVRSSYPRNVSGVRRILDVLVRQGVSPIFTSTGPPGPGRWAFDFVFDVRARDLIPGPSDVLFCERAPVGAPFRTGGSARLVDLPAIVAALAGRPSPSPPTS
jgi:hypothetical protein